MTTKERLRRILRRVETYVHTGYFGAVGWEAHGWYGMLGGAMFAISLVSFLVDGEEV